jgi:DamX protein
VKIPTNTRLSTSASGYPLISRERTQKLDLLNHLILNLAHTIVVCGPEGVGKTRLLQTFKEAAADSWLFCWLDGDSQLSLEKIQEVLGERVVQGMPGLKFQSLASAFDRLAEHNNKIVLVVDDAGKLAPGMVEKIISYAERKAALRVILTLTHSEIYLKNGTDPAIEDCYQIDIPPLSEKQCGDFLEYLSTLQNPRIQFAAINESMVAALYRETHGIPGNILTHLPAADNSKKIDYSNPVLIGAVAALIVLALGVQWWSSRPKKAASPAAVTVTQNKAVVIQQPLSNPTAQLPMPAPATVPAQVNPPQPVIQQQQAALPQAPAAPQEIQKPADGLAVRPSTGVRNDVIDDSHSQAQIEEDLQQDNTQLPAPHPAIVPNNEQIQANDKAQLSEAATAPTQVQTSNEQVSDAGGQWIKAQPAENYTLQLMALTDEHAIIEVLQRHQALGQNLRYFKTTTKSGKDRFVLYYGSFASPELAKKEVGTLPKELQKTWMRKISEIHDELKVLVPSDTPE